MSDPTSQPKTYGGYTASTWTKGGGNLFEIGAQGIAGDMAYQNGILGYQSGLNDQLSFNAQALQAEQNAGQAMAVVQRNAQEVKRQVNLVQSRIITLAAASGAGASDPGVMNLIAGQAGIGALKAAQEIYKGEDQARTMRVLAVTKRYEGEKAKYAGQQAMYKGAADQYGAEVGQVGSLISMATQFM